MKSALEDRLTRIAGRVGVVESVIRKVVIAKKQAEMKKLASGKVEENFVA